MRGVLSAAFVAVVLGGAGCAGSKPISTVGGVTSNPNTVLFGAGGSGYLAVAKGPRKRAGILVLQEWWGVNDWIRGNADRFAEQGYVALAVDLYRGSVATSTEDAHELMRGMPEDRALRDLHAAFDFLAKRDDVDPEKIGAVGWCMGGGYALAFAVDEPKLRAVVINYGRLVTDEGKLAGIRASLLGNFAGQDKGIPPTDVDAFAATLKSKGREVDVKIYGPEGHAFMNPNNKPGYHEEAARDAWSRIDAFFARTLGG